MVAPDVTQYLKCQPQPPASLPDSDLHSELPGRTRRAAPQALGVPTPAGPSASPATCRILLAQPPPLQASLLRPLLREPHLTVLPNSEGHLPPPYPLPVFFPAAHTRGCPTLRKHASLCA